MTKQPTHADLVKAIKKLILENWRRAGGIGTGARDIKTVADALDIPLLL